ncbi:RHOMBOID-like protein [Mycena venus]|uniref:Rhomboid-type serine protease n=1 Tax=Mycena venus TaxID=2733690 RepID=A0A8H6XWW8_9AGAR|nr:RHOMBOID-like protein [Mycena venus]
MAAPYDHYAYSAAKTHDNYFETPNPRSYPEHIPEDEGFNPSSIPDRSKAYDGLSDRDNFNYHDQEQGHAMHDHSPEGSPPGQEHDSHEALVPRGYQDLEYSEPDPYNAERAKPVAEKASPLVQFLGMQEGKSSLQQRIDMKKRGVGRQRYPFLVWILTAAMVATFIYELVANNNAQGSPVSFKPVVNYMLGPSSTTLINVGARFPPCMKLVDAVPPTEQIGCLNNTANPATEICTIEDICGFGGFHGKDPNQWFRFITPIFLHAGFVHIILNMLAQLTVSAQVEREMGSGGFFITYFAAGIFGNVLGANFALVGRPSVGASGAIFGTVAVTWVDLFAHWKYHYRPGRKLAFMAIELVIGVAVGYIPYVDNFAHLGGFVMALFVGTIFYPVISATKRHRIWMTTARILAIPAAVILFVLLTRNFYTSDPYAACEGCRYLSCFPTSSNDHCKGTGLTTTTSV